MQIKLFVASAALALAATISSASAGDEFTTLGGIAVAPMSAMELDSIRGARTEGLGAIIVDVEAGSVFRLFEDPTGNAPPPIVVICSPATASCFIVAQIP